MSGKAKELYPQAARVLCVPDVETAARRHAHGGLAVSYGWYGNDWTVNKEVAEVVDHECRLNGLSGGELLAKLAIEPDQCAPECRWPRWTRYGKFQHDRKRGPERRGT